MPASTPTLPPSHTQVWASQVTSFIREVVWPQTASPAPVVLAGNSLGGYVSLAAAAEGGPGLVRGVALLNGAGPFREPGAPTPEQVGSVVHDGSYCRDHGIRTVWKGWWGE